MALFLHLMSLSSCSTCIRARVARQEMIQCLTPLFTLITSMILDGRRYNSWAYWAMIPVCGGGAICSFNEVNFSVVGCTLSVSAVVFRSLKTILQGSSAETLGFYRNHCFFKGDAGLDNKDGVCK